MVEYAKKVLQVVAVLSLIRDSRKFPQIATPIIVKSVFAMFIARVGSLNGLEQLKKSPTLRDFIGDRLPSADTIGRVFGKINPDTTRRANCEIYTRLKRTKCLELLDHGLVPLNIDGHESHATYQQCCDGCLKRTINKGTESEKIQFYHRHVTAQLVFRNFPLLVDAEPQLPGEDEVACAMRLLKRVLVNYSRAFDVVVGDALYARSDFFNMLIEQKKDVIAVLKDDRRDLFKDAESLFSGMSPTFVFERNDTRVECWDEDEFHSWPQVSRSVRVIRTVETKRSVRRQLDSKLEDQPVSSWTWVTTLSPVRARTQAVVEMGHSRWSIENQGFNESVNHYFSDHVYKHDPVAMLNFWLLSMMASNIFRCFYLRNLKPIVRASYSMLHIAREVQSELYQRSALVPHPS